MVKEVRIHIEGGGDSRDQKSSLRQGFSKFFKELVNETKSKKIECSIIMCGTRNHAFRDF